jgi:hypothetical protein
MTVQEFKQHIKEDVNALFDNDKYKNVSNDKQKVEDVRKKLIDEFSDTLSKDIFNFIQELLENYTVVNFLPTQGGVLTGGCMSGTTPIGIFAPTSQATGGKITVTLTSS